MRKLSRRIGIKVVAWLLLAASLTVLTASGTGLCFLLDAGAFSDNGLHIRQMLVRDYTRDLARLVMSVYGDSDTFYDYCQAVLQPEFRNFYFTVTNESGAVTATNGTTENAQYEDDFFFDQPVGEAERVVRTFNSRTEMRAWLDQQEDIYYYSTDSVLRYGVELLSLRRDLDAAGYDEVPPLSVIDPTDGEAEYQVGVPVYFDSTEARRQWLYTLEARQFEFTYATFEEEIGIELVAQKQATEAMTLHAQIPQSLTAKDSLYYSLWLYNHTVPHRTAIAVVLAVSAVLTLFLIVFLCCGAGWHPGEDAPRLNWFHRIPLEIIAMCAFLISCIPLAIFWDASRYAWIGLLFVPPAGLAVILTLVTLAARVKCGCWWRGTVIYHCLLLALRVAGWGWGVLRRMLAWLWRHVANTAHWWMTLILGLPLVWQLALGWMLLFFVELFLLAAWGSDDALAVWLLEKIILTPLLLMVGIQLTRLRDAARRMAQGDLRSQVELRHMRGDIRRHGEDLNNITAGLQAAVAEQMRSERLKTELITNVSHDIKTPLTSIVNYVNLLSQEEMPSDTAREYLEVLQRQSARLRKLTEDLVDASKAATGNVETHLERMDINVLLTQTAGEYEEKLRALDLEPVLSLEEDALQICADGRLLWRVFDNLMSNICKYAMPGTRVYLSALRNSETVEIVFRNISRYALNISSEELMERFVRGDASRSTEGSGLGLSIARSLTELQGGSFALTVDGDLFKVTIRFATA